jgi:hypothetical protein
MGNQAYRAFEPGVGPSAESTWIEPASGPIRIVASREREFGPTPRRTGEEEADYCRGRAEAEAKRAEEAAHPIARPAHLEMAGRYRERALAARQAGIPEIQDWISEGGSWLAGG